jgi:bla regulator protein blaR1
VSGVTGADLKKRMVQIMTDRVVRKLNFARKLLLWMAACLAIALPIALGLFNVTPTRAESPRSSVPKFASVFIKPHPAENQGFMMQKMMMAPVRDGGGFTARGISLHSLLRGAYMVQDTQIIGEPDWAKSEKYDIDAKADPSVAEQTRNLGDQQDRLRAQQMLQQLVTDYFKVSLHQEVQDQTVYELVVGEGGSRLQRAPESKKMAMMRMGIGELNSEGTPLDLLVAQLSQRLGRTVVDKTGLKGNYVFNLHWTPDADEQARIRAAAPGLPEPGVDKPSASGPPLMTAVEEQLGLKLQPTTERVPVLIIDHAEQPAQN